MILGKIKEFIVIISRMDRGRGDKGRKIRGTKMRKKRKMKMWKKEKCVVGEEETEERGRRRKGI